MNPSRYGLGFHYRRPSPKQSGFLLSATRSCFAAFQHEPWVTNTQANLHSTGMSSSRDGFKEDFVGIGWRMRPARGRLKALKDYDRLKEEDQNWCRQSFAWNRVDWISASEACRQRSSFSILLEMRAMKRRASLVRFWMGVESGGGALIVEVFRAVGTRRTTMIDFMLRSSGMLVIGGAHRLKAVNMVASVDEAGWVSISVGRPNSNWVLKLTLKPISLQRTKPLLMANWVSSVFGNVAWI